jgi:hypothetical protein
MRSEEEVEQKLKEIQIVEIASGGPSKGTTVYTAAEDALRWVLGRKREDWLPRDDPS